MVTVRMARVIMVVMIMVVAASVMIIGGLLKGLDIEPRARIRTWVGRVETRRRQELADCHR